MKGGGKMKKNRISKYKKKPPRKRETFPQKTKFM